MYLFCLGSTCLNYTDPMHISSQCFEKQHSYTAYMGCFPRGKRAAMVHTAALPNFFFVLFFHPYVQCFRVSIITGCEAYSFTTDGFEIFNMRATLKIPNHGIQCTTSGKSTYAHKHKQTHSQSILTASQDKRVNGEDVRKVKRHVDGVRQCEAEEAVVLKQWHGHEHNGPCMDNTRHSMNTTVPAWITQDTP